MVYIGDCRRLDCTVVLPQMRRVHGKSVAEHGSQFSYFRWEDNPLIVSHQRNAVSGTTQFFSVWPSLQTVKPSADGSPQDDNIINYYKKLRCLTSALHQAQASSLYWCCVFSWHNKRRCLLWSSCKFRSFAAGPTFEASILLGILGLNRK